MEICTSSTVGWADTAFDTRDLRRDRQHLAWAGWINENFGKAEVDIDRRSDINGRIETAVINKLLFMASRASLRQTVKRNSQHVRQCDREQLSYILVTAGGCRVTQEGRDAVAYPGDGFFLSTRRPYELHDNDDCGLLEVTLPIAQIADRVPRVELAVARTLVKDNPVGRLIAAFLRALPASLANADAAARNRIERMSLDLLAEGARECTLEAESAVTTHRYNRLLRAKQFIRANLQDPELNRTTVADSTGVCVRELNRLFAEEQSSVSQYIRLRRLERAAVLLDDATCAGLNMTEIAWRCGFSDSGQFSKLFRAQHDMTPTEFRRRTFVPAERPFQPACAAIPAASSEDA